MANHVYSGYRASSYGGAVPATSTPTLSYSASRSLADISSGRYLMSDPLSADSPNRYSSFTDRSASIYLTQNDAFRFSAADIASRTPHFISHSSWAAADIASALDSVVPGTKRPYDALYHQTVLGAHNTIGQTEAWYTTNSLVKRPRFESTSNLPIYPQRPGEKDCAHYMLTRTCKFGDSCKFDHPIWVPEGGIPDWKEVSHVAPSESLPERPGEPDCPYFLKTQRCKYGVRCKFNHPKDILASVGALGNADISSLPERPFEPLCAFYIKTGKCKFGATCKFHHPKDIQIPLAGLQNGNGEQAEFTGKTEEAAANLMSTKQPVSFTPALSYNSKGLPIRLGEVDCPFYLKTGSCKYSITCRYNHIDRNAINPPAAAIVHPVVASAPANLNIGVVNPASSVYQTIDPILVQPSVVGSIIYPQKPGQIECDYYMKTGECKFGERCRFHHPIDRFTATAEQAAQQNVKLTPAGLPRREGAIICPYYLKTATCKYGASCKFNHPPPGEVMAMTASQGTSVSFEGEVKVDEKTAELAREQVP